MAAETPRPERLDHNLRLIAAALVDLVDIADEWEQESIDVRSAWDYEWRDYMDRLGLLRQAYEAGRLSADQQRRYLGLLRALEANLPLIERLGLQRPPVPLNV